MVVSHSQSTYFLEFSRVTPLRNGLATKQRERIFVLFLRGICVGILLYCDSHVDTTPESDRQHSIRATRF